MKGLLHQIRDHSRHGICFGLLKPPVHGQEVLATRHVVDEYDAVCTTVVAVRERSEAFYPSKARPISLQSRFDRTDESRGMSLSGM